MTILQYVLKCPVIFCDYNTTFFALCGLACEENILTKRNAYFLPKHIKLEFVLESLENFINILQKRRNFFDAFGVHTLYGGHTPTHPGGFYRAPYQREVHTCSSVLLKGYIGRHQNGGHKVVKRLWKRTSVFDCPKMCAEKGKRAGNAVIDY